MSVDADLERFQRAPFHSQLADVERLIPDLRSKTVDPAQVRQIERIEQGIEKLKSRFAIVDVKFVGTTALARMQSGSRHLLSALGSFVADGNPAHLKQANDQLDDPLLLTAFSLPTFATPDVAMASLGQAYTESRDSIRRHQEEVAEALREQQAQSDQAVREILNQLVQRTAQLSALDKGIAEQTDRVTRQNERIDSVVAEFNSRSASLEQQREQRYQEWAATKADETTARFAELSNGFDSVIAGANVESKKLLTGLTELRDQAASIVNVVGNIGATGDYRTNANANDFSANWLRWGSIALLLAMVATIVYLVFEVGQGVSWQLILFRMTAALVLALPAGYMALESNRHREEARRLRRLELEIASIDAFMALIPSEQRATIKAELTKKYFGNLTEVQAHADMSTKEILKEIRAFVRVFRK